MKRHAWKISALMCATLLCAVLAQAQRRSSSSLSIPAGTPIHVRVNENLSSETSRAGDTFTGVLAQAVVVNGRTVFPRGASATGQVISAKESGRLSDPGVLELALVSIDNRSISSEPFEIKGVSHTRSNVAKIGGATAAGAVIGGIAGGGKGAAIGAGVGAGAGTATAAATGKKPATVESEAVLTFVSNGPADSYANQPGSGNQYDDRGRDYPDRQTGRRHSHYDDDENYDDDDQGDRFDDRDREVLRGCLAGYDFESLPPGIQKKLERGGTLPPGQAKKLHPLPRGCTARLPRLPRDVERIIFGDRVILLGSGDRILDMYFVER